MKNKIKNIKGFSLLELLVVVLIIGVLAGVALPQYQLAVERARFATVKENAHVLARAVQHYYSIHDKRPKNLDELDVAVPSGCFFSNASDALLEVKCSTGKNTYDVVVYFTSPKINTVCFANSINKFDIANRVCQAETGRKNPSNSSTSYLSYLYQ